jgi:hypothetical protein
LRKDLDALARAQLEDNVDSRAVVKLWTRFERLAEILKLKVLFA